MPKKQAIKKSAQSPVALVAGGAGFIGSHLISALLEKKARVVVLDNFNTGKEIHVKEFLSNSNFALYNVDINQGIPQEIESVDYVFHLAGVEEYLFSKDFLNLDSLLTNSYGTKNLLDLAQRSEAKFILASSVDVYQGRMSQLDLAEYFGRTQEDNTKYSLIEAKRFAEALVWEYFKKHDLDVRIVRLPEIFGPKMSLDSSGVLGRFMKDLIEGRDITIYGDGYEKEYYLYISDAVSGILKSLFVEGTKGKIYSLLDGESVSSLEVAFMLKGLADREMDIQFRPGDVAARPKLIPPDALNLRDISWRPHVTFKQGVIKTLSWFGYAANEYGFKPGKLIAQKKKQSAKRAKESVPDKEVLTLQGIKEPSQPAVAAAPLQGLKKNDVAPTEPAPAAVSQSSPVQPSPPPVQPPPSIAPLQPLPKVSSGPAARKAPLFKLGKKKKKGKSPVKPPVVASKAKSSSNKLSAGLTFGLLGVLISAVLIFLIIPGLRFYYNLSTGVKELKAVSEAVYMFDADLVSTRAEASYKNLYKAKRNLASIRWAFALINNKDRYYSVDKMISSLAHFSQATHTMADIVTPFESLWGAILPNSEETLDIESFNNAVASLSVVKTQFKIAEADFTQVDKGQFPESYQADLDSYAQILSLGLDEIDAVGSLIQDLPEVLGMVKAKKYIIWFQNSNELRPTGGFIGSYGLLEFSGGKLVDLTIDDIYNPDGQLDIRNITVAPPKQIADYLVEDRLYLRNSNWDPDFPTSAETFKDLYFKVTGEMVDGVLAVDLNFTSALLDAIGPVFLTAYNEEISSNNLYERTQFYSEFNYENGSDQKKSFLTVLGSKLLEKIFALDQKQLPVLLDSLGKSLDARHILVYIPDLSLSAYIKAKGWDGSLVSTDENYLYVVNSNLGGNKADYFIRPSMQFEVESLTRDGLLRGTLQLSYEHTGQDVAWPGGVYENYVRVLTGYGAKLTSAKLINSDGTESDVMSDIAISSELAKTTFGYGIEVEPRETIKLILGVDLPASLSITDSHKLLDLYWQKQPGTVGTPVEFVFTPPFGTTIDQVSGSLEIIDKMVKFNGSLTEDKSFVVQLR